MSGQMTNCDECGCRMPVDELCHSTQHGSFSVCFRHCDVQGGVE